MKKLTVLLITFLMFACTQNDEKVKVIENYDAQYFPSSQVDFEHAENKSVFESMSDDLEQIVGNIANDSQLPLKTYVYFRIYVNERGNVDGVKELQIKDESILNSQYFIKLDSKELISSIAKAAEKWKFSPAMRNDKPAKYHGDIEAIVAIDEDGKVTVEIPTLQRLSKGLAKLNFNGDDKYFVAVEEQPFPIGGLEAIQEKIKYPEKAKLNGVQGRVFVKAYINENGEVDGVELLKGIDSECDSVAMAAVKQTKFTPGKQHSKPVKVQVSIPIVFKLR